MPSLASAAFTTGAIRMSLGKGLVFATIGAALGAVVWGGLSYATDMRLWILAPIVGGAAGYGMMRGTSMKGGLPAGALAALVTIVAIFATRHTLVTHEVDKALAIDAETIRSTLASEVADEWAEDDIAVFDTEEEDFTAEVYDEADSRWHAMSETEQSEYVALLRGESESDKAFLTPLALLFDFGIIGTLCAALSAGAAFKGGSITLESALVENGQATTADEANLLAANLREEDARRRTGFEPGLTTIESHAAPEAPGAESSPINPPLSAAEPASNPASPPSKPPPPP